jgi:serine/threonine protein kinase
MMLIVPGTTIGRYVVEKTIGTGGMALALRCRLATVGGFQKYVLLKILHPEHMEDPQYIEMFLDEARVTAGLTHPNIPQTFELEQHEGLPYLVMEFVDGPSLQAILRKIEHEPHKHYGLVAWIMAGVCRALSYAHTRIDPDGQALNIIHRDVSLANILVNMEGIPKLVDFGIAKSRLAKSVTEVGTLKGKLLYLAPEQIVGESLDHRVDIYQTGVCLYWLSTGRAPLTTEDPVRFFRERLDNDPPLPSELNPDYPALLERIVLKALVRDRDRRWPDASNMAEALEDFAKSEGVDSRTAAKKLKALFQQTDANGAIYNSHEPSGAYPRINSLTPVPGSGLARKEQVHRPSMQWSFVAAATILVLAVIAVAGWMQGPPSPAQSPVAAIATMIGSAICTTIPSPAHSAVAAIATVDDQARSMASEAGKKIDEGNMIVASKLVEQIQRLTVTDGALLVQIAELDLRYQRALGLSEVKRLLSNEQSMEALDRCRLLLDTHLDDAEVQTLLAECKRAVEGNIQRSTDRGSLSVASSPGGATVYIDDVAVGRTPLSGLNIPVGKHTINVRLRGYSSQQRLVEIKNSRQESVKLDLQPIQDKTVPPTQAGVPTATIPSPEITPSPRIIPSPETVSTTQAPPLEAAMLPESSARVAPSASGARSAADVQQVLRSVEAQAVRSGVPPEIANGVTDSLRAQLLALSPPPEVYLLYPSEMLQIIQSGVANGNSKEMIAAELRRRYGRLGPIGQ